MAPRDHRDPVVVRSGNVRIEIVGTDYAVYRYRGETQVKVFEGVVAVSAEGVRHLIKAGGQWPATPMATEPEVEVPDPPKPRNKQEKAAESST